MNPTFDLEQRLGGALTARGWTLAVAESCTGGLLSHRVTQVAGASDYFVGGVISYANQAKQDLLGVGEATLMAHGAVSQETALEMAQGVRRALGSDVGVAITGIAGPAGGTPEKPVGLTWIAVVTPAGERSQAFVYTSDRVGNKLEASESALTMTLQAVSESNDE
jgi:PncC family amidohydrolase